MVVEEPVSLTDIIAENWDKFSTLRDRAKRAFKDLTSELPPDFYESLKADLLRFIFPKGRQSKLTVKLVIDTNIIIRDAFRVAKGKPSTTERLLSSAFVEVMAPPNIVEEVQETIRKDLPPGASLEKALVHARSLLSRVKIFGANSDAYLEARKRIWSRVGADSPGDVSFLALAIETGADALVSGDKKAFEHLEEMRRWEMSKTAEVILTYEGGTLFLFLGSIGLDLSWKMLQQVLILTLGALEETLEIVVGIVGNLAKGSVDALSSLPSWAWAMIVGALGGILLLAIVNEGFRAGFAEIIAKVIAQIKTMFEAVLAAVEYFWQAIREILVIVWNMSAPIVVPNLIVIAGVMSENLAGLLRQAQGNFEGLTSGFE